MSTTVTKKPKTNRKSVAANISFLRPDYAHSFTENSLTVLARRYLVKDEQGNPTESPEDLFWRVATTIARVDMEKYGATQEQAQALAESFYRMMLDRKWLPNSPTLMNAGRPLGQLSACFVLPVEDALSNGRDGIYDTLRSMALVHQSGGGTGFSFSRLRPKGSIVRSTTGVASGPVSFMSLYDSSTEVVKQGGTRRGANMGILRVDHPDIREFITCKSDVTKITNFNISVAITDAFMEALKAGTNYDIIDPRSGEKVGEENAQEIFDMIVEGAWATGEPGVFFIDRANHYNPVPKLGQYEATNPCGEQCLLPFDVCNLGSVNLGMFVDTDKDPSLHWRERVDWEELGKYTRLSMHFLDNVIDANQYPLQEITDLAQKIRRVGNGVMGWADMLIKLGIAYDSDEGIEVARAVSKFFHEQCLAGSEELAQTRGTFPAWEESIWGPDETCARDSEGNRIRPMRRLRNCNVNTVAPTGTISIFADCSGGIEPIFAVAFMRNQAGALMPDVNKDFVALAKKEGWYSEELMRQIAESGTIELPEVPSHAQSIFRIANQISPEYHVRMQAAWQENTDSSISKTCNFAESATREDVREIYLKAFDLGCKGITVYRDNSRPMQVLSTGKNTVGSTESAPSSEVEDLRRELEGLKAKVASTRHRTIRKRPEMLAGRTWVTNSPLGKMYVTINSDESNNPFEVFATLGKAGGAAMADVEAICRLISLSLRSGIALPEVHKQLRGISSDRAFGMGPNKILSVPDAIAQVIEKFVAESAGVQEELPLDTAPATGAKPAPSMTSPETLLSGYKSSDYLLQICEGCNSSGTLAFQEGCLKCQNPECGWSECG